MTARSELRSAFAEAVAKVSGMKADDVDRCGPPALVFRVQDAHSLRFECRPMSSPPDENWVGLMYRPTPDGGARQAGVGMFKDGRFTNGSGKALDGDLYWTAIVDERRDG